MVDDAAVNGCNPGIRRTVKWLNELGYDTCDSGDGETHEHECDRAEGYVVVRLRPDQNMINAADHIHAELQRMGIQFDATPGACFIQAFYSPLDGVQLVDIHGITDAMLGDRLG